MGIVNAATIDNTIVTNIIVIDVSEIDGVTTVLIPDDSAFPIQIGDSYIAGTFTSNAVTVITQDNGIAAIDSILNSL
jgi:predicted nucleic acid-binding protein